MSVELFILHTLLRLSKYIAFLFHSAADRREITAIQNDIQNVINQLSEQ